jgi:CBS domain-containing protein
MTVGRICVREVDTADPEESVQVAAERMHSRNVGTLIVLNERQQPIGMVTDRDLTIKVLARGLDGTSVTVREVMSPGPKSIQEETPIESALKIMRDGPYRRVPVVDEEGKLVGLLSLDDILDLLAEEFGEIGALVRRSGPRALA